MLLIGHLDLGRTLFCTDFIPIDSSKENCFLSLFSVSYKWERPGWSCDEFLLVLNLSYLIEKCFYTSFSAVYILKTDFACLSLTPFVSVNFKTCTCDIISINILSSSID